MRNLTLAGLLLVFVVVPLLVMKYGEGRQDEHKQIAHISNGLALAGNAKGRVHEYYSRYGEMPKDGSVLHLPPPESISDQAVESVAVENGAVVVTYNERTGVEGGVLKLIPSVPENGYMMKWRCETPSYSFIGEYMPQCRYVER